MKPGVLIWITGLAGSGKTTVALDLFEKLSPDLKCVHLDGDQLRWVLGEESTHDIEGRKRTARIYSRLCSSLTKQGITVIMSTISLFHEIHEFNRLHNDLYLEILLETEKEVLHGRDKKNLYSAPDGKVMGINQHPEIPLSPDLILKNNNEEDIHTNVYKIINLLKEKYNG